MRAVPAGDPVAPAIAAELTTTASGADSWPDDDEFRAQWDTRRFYNGCGAIAC